mgnify:CR=1 FL=1
MDEKVEFTNYPLTKHRNAFRDRLSNFARVVHAVLGVCIPLVDITFHIRNPDIISHDCWCHAEVERNRI